MNNIKKQTAANLKNARINSKMLQAELAVKLHVNQQTISHWETGRRGIPLDKAVEASQSALQGYYSDFFKVKGESWSSHRWLNESCITDFNYYAIFIITECYNESQGDLK